jgi:hypothetical protein
MTDLDTGNVSDRLRAWSAGKPLPRWGTRCVDIAEDPFIVALVRIGGEGRPSAIAFGKASTTPSVVTTPDSRKPEAVAEMVEKFGIELLREFPPEDALDVWPQMLLPDRSHLELIHQMAYAYAFSKYPLAEMQRLNTVGRLMNSLFLQWQNPLQNTVLLASEALQSLYIFPASQARLGHLGFLLEWLVDHGGRAEQREAAVRAARLEAAVRAEQRSVSTSLDGAFENQRIADLLRRYAESQHTQEATAAAIKRVLEDEALSRWNLTRAAHQTINGDSRPANFGLRTLRSFSRRSWNRLWVLPRQKELNGQRVYWRGLETDMTAIGSAEEMMITELASQIRQEALAHGDREIALTLVNRGKAVHGTAIRPSTESGLLTVHYDNSVEIDFRGGTTYRLFGTADLEVKYESADPARRIAHFIVEKGRNSFKDGDEVILIEYTPDFFVTNKIRNMVQQPTTQLGQIFRRPLTRAGNSADESGAAE